MKYNAIEKILFLETADLDDKVILSLVSYSQINLSQLTY